MGTYDSANLHTYTDPCIYFILIITNDVDRFMSQQVDECGARIYK